MATARIGGLRAYPPTRTARIGGFSTHGSTAVTGATGRVGGIAARGAPAASPQTARVGGLRARGAAVAGATARLHGLHVTGTVLITLAAVVPRTVEPFATVPTTVSKSAGAAPTSYVWRQISGPTVTLTGSGATRTFTAPADFASTDVVLGVVAKDASNNSSPEVQILVTSRPHTVFKQVGGIWVAVPLSVLK